MMCGVCDNNNKKYCFQMKVFDQVIESAQAQLYDGLIVAWLRLEALIWIVESIKREPG